MEAAARPEGIPGVGAKGPFPVGQYAAFLKDRFKEIARVQVFGEVWNLRMPPKGARIYFELRDVRGDADGPGRRRPVAGLRALSAR